MAKPATLDGYSDQYTVDCERVLVTLLRGLGPWKESVYLVGGLTPRYLVAARPPAVPAHAGTLDVDIVIDLQILADTDAYHTLEDKVAGKLYGRGLFISVNGFSPEVIRSLVMGKEIQTLFIDGEDLILVLEEHLSLREMIDRKVKAAQTKGLIYVHPISGAEKKV
jgi:hypothetical protein